MNIVYALTANYHSKAYPSIKSLREHNPNARIILVTDTNDTQLPIDELIDISNQHWFTPGDVNYANPYTYINLLKVCYPSIIPNADKVIHMDADTIICDSLEPLWRTDLTGKWFAACPEYQGPYHPFGDVYYNMGIAVINLQQMREDKIQDKLVEYLNAYKQPFADQDAWNIYGIKYDKALPFRLRYNENAATGFTKHPAIVHYCGNPKWYEDKTMHRREYLERYL